MGINSSKANAIKTYVGSHKNAKLGEWPIEIAGRVRKEPYYSLPINLLRYSVENGRFAAEKLALELELNRVLDSESDADKEEIRKMLLDADPEATEKLKKDILEKGQLHPGVITADGYVKNGNRRMAILEALHKEHPSGKYEYLAAIILPEDVSEPDLWRIEAGLQLSQETKLNYGPINELLKLKEGKKAGLNEEEMASVMYGWTADKVREALDRLNLIDQYLAFWYIPNKYKDAENTAEYFIDLQKLIRNWDNEGIEKIDINKRIEVAFSYIRNVGRPDRKTSHKDIRRMGEIFESFKASEVFLNSVSESTLKRTENNPEASSDYLAYEAFKDAIDIVDAEKERNRPDRLLNRAIHSLEEISSIIDSSDDFNNDQNMKLVNKIKTLIDEILEKVEKNGKKNTPGY